jgi:hypothetical protein
MPNHSCRRRLLPALLALGLVLGACSGDDSDPAEPEPTTTSTVANDPGLAGLLLGADELPGTFVPVEEVGDTVPTFCVGQDPTAGLRASARAVAGYAREPAGVSVLQLLFRFDDDGAATFVEQARAVIDACHEVPDLNGLAFTYRDAPAGAVAALAGLDASVTADGVSVGSGALRSIVGVFQRGDLGGMVAVLAAGDSGPDAEAVAVAAFTAAAENLTSG